VEIVVVNTISYRRGRLPHWIVADRAYFVTITQKGSIPAYRLAEINENIKIESARFVEIDQILDKQPESFRVLTYGSIAKEIVTSLAWLESDERGWIMYAACVMPSHIHLVMRNINGRSAALEKDISAFKNYTARICNVHLGRSGRFWAKESFDHWCRDGISVSRSVAYTLRNPVRAGLVTKVEDWPWYKVGGEFSDFAKML
jgi:REP element-mobilizing transposase RayT